jgi:hypothetical protein
MHQFLDGRSRHWPDLETGSDGFGQEFLVPFRVHEPFAEQADTLFRQRRATQ